MSDSLIEQVKRLAEESARVETKLKSVGGHFGAEAAFHSYDHLARQFDFPALLAHIATQAEALKVAVEALKKYSDPHKYEDRGMGILVAPDDATAALSRIAALTGEKK